MRANEGSQPRFQRLFFTNSLSEDSLSKRRCAPKNFLLIVMMSEFLTIAHLQRQLNPESESRQSESTHSALYGSRGFVIE